MQRTQEDFMQIRNAYLAGASAACDEDGDLLDCRMGMLGLDLCAIATGDTKTFEDIKRQCMSCSFREACALDLKRDPNDPVWETYCPNAAVLNGLAEVWWLT
jgi:hypothetical protein